MPDNLMPPMADYLRISPEIIITVFGIIVMMLEAVSKGKRTYLGVIGLVGLVGAFAANLPGLIAEPGPAFHNMVTVDGYGVFFRAVVIGVGFLSTLASLSYLDREESKAGGEFYSLILFSVALWLPRPI